MVCYNIINYNKLQHDYNTRNLQLEKSELINIQRITKKGITLGGKENIQRFDFERSIILLVPNMKL